MEALVGNKTRMRFSLIVLLVCSMVLIFQSCENDEDEIEEKGKDEFVDYAPNNIKGKTLTLYNSKLKVVQKAYGFTSAGSCNVPMLTSDFSLIGTPAYTYVKGDDNTASFRLLYTYKLQISSDYVKSEMSIVVNLTYTSESGGTYSGTETDVSTGNVPALNGTSTRAISGSFELL